MGEEKYVDESWKEDVARDKEIHKLPPSDAPLGNQAQADDLSAKDPRGGLPLAGQAAPEQAAGEDQEFDFLSYISSLAFQAMIFLGKLPNPLNNQTQKNLRQAKFLIDTLALLKEKTQGNLTQEENDMLHSALYELQMSYVEVMNQEGKIS